MSFSASSKSKGDTPSSPITKIKRSKNELSDIDENGEEEEEEVVIEICDSGSSKILKETEILGEFMTNEQAKFFNYIEKRGEKIDVEFLFLKFVKITCPLLVLINIVYIVMIQFIAQLSKHDNVSISIGNSIMINTTVCLVFYTLEALRYRSMSQKIHVRYFSRIYFADALNNMRVSVFLFFIYVIVLICDAVTLVNLNSECKKNLSECNALSALWIRIYNK